MRVLLKVSWDGEEADPGCDYAVVTLTPEVAKSILRRAGAFKEAKTVDGDLFKIYFHVRQDQIQFYAVDALESILAEEFGEDQHTAMVENGFVELPDSFPALPEHDTTNVHCPQVRIYEDGVRWSADSKHCDVEVQTALLFYETVEQFIK